MKITLLPDFINELVKNVAPRSFVKFHSQMKRWKDLFIRNDMYKKVNRFFEDFKAGSVTKEDLIRYGVKEANIAKYVKATGHEYIPSKEEIAKEASLYNKKTGAKKLPRPVSTLRLTQEQLKKDIEETKKKLAAATKK
jgi:hypothetical protein